MKGPFCKAGAGEYPSSLPSFLESPCTSGTAGLPKPPRFGVLLPLFLHCHPLATRWVLLYSSTSGHLEVNVVDFCQIPCLNGGRCIGRDECWCPANSTGKFCHLPAPKLDRESPERGSHPRDLLEVPLRQSTFTLPLSNQLGEHGAGRVLGWEGHWGTGRGCWHRGGGREAVGSLFFSQTLLLLLCSSGSVSFPKVLFALPQHSSVFWSFPPTGCYG